MNPHHSLYAPTPPPPISAATRAATAHTHDNHLNSPPLARVGATRADAAHGRARNGSNPPSASHAIRADRYAKSASAPSRWMIAS